jgi:hypothetical protein
MLSPGKKPVGTISTLTRPETILDDESWELVPKSGGTFSYSQYSVENASRQDPLSTKTQGDTVRDSLGRTNNQRKDLEELIERESRERLAVLSFQGQMVRDQYCYDDVSYD